MSMIRFSTDEVFGVDSQEYEVLANAVTKVKGVEGALVEIGTRRGGSAKLIIDTLTANSDTNRSLFCIDPYGNIAIDCTNLNMSLHNPDRVIEGDKNSKELVSPQKFDYTNTMRNRTIPSLYFYAYQAGLNFTFFCLEDTEFFKRYADGVPVYNEEKKIENKYSFVFFDGPHTTPEVLNETKFFVERSVIGSVFVYDDEWMLDTEGTIIPYLIENGFEILQRGNIKGSYRRVR
jgi:hypothetical protein